MQNYAFYAEQVEQERNSLTLIQTTRRVYLTPETVNRYNLKWPEKIFLFNSYNLHKKHHNYILLALFVCNKNSFQ